MSNLEKITELYSAPATSEEDGPAGEYGLKEEFTFTSEKERVVGNLYLPRQKPIGIVLTTGPLTSVKEQAAGAYAEAMAQRGFVSLAFDHRHFGESGGQPRQFENPRIRIQDIQNAATALLKEKRFAELPVYGIGVCFGAGPMVLAVMEDPRFKAFAGVAGVYTDGKRTKTAAGKDYNDLINQATEAQRKWKETGIAEIIPAVGPNGGNVAMPLREAYEFYGTPRGGVANYVNAFAIQSRAYTLPFDVMGSAPRMKTPILVVHSEKALLPDLAREFYSKLTAPKKEVWLTSVGQIDFYDDPRLINKSADEIAIWFMESITR